jgi:opacity protein-like surface antigen
MASNRFAAPDQIAPRGSPVTIQICLISQAVRVSAIAAAGIYSGHAANAHAADRNGLYVAAAVTGSKLQKPEQTIANAPTPGSTLQVVNDVDFGWGGQIELGYAYKFVRIEAEIGRTTNHSGSYSAISPITITIPQDGTNRTTRYMANVLFDLPVKGLPVQPYIGGGIGAAHSYVSTFAAPARAPNAPPSQLLAFSETLFAYQLMGGVSVPLGLHTALTAQYRWLDSGTVNGLDARGQVATRKLRGSNVDFGLRFLF